MAHYFVEKQFEYAGFDCAVVMQEMGHRCGYVGVPEGHPLYGISYPEIEEKYDVHGGITFSSSRGNESYPVKTSKKVWWFGFDCAHYDDIPDFDTAIKEIPESEDIIGTYRDMYHNYLTEGTVKSLDYVISQCKYLADQFKEAAE